MENQKNLNPYEIKAKIADTMRAMPKKQQLIVSLYTVDNLSIREIAATLNMTEVETRMLFREAIAIFDQEIYKRLNLPQFNKDFRAQYSLK